MCQSRDLISSLPATELSLPELLWRGCWGLLKSTCTSSGVAVVATSTSFRVAASLYYTHGAVGVMSHEHSTNISN